MKRMLFAVAFLGLLVNACSPVATAPVVSSPPEVNLEATAALLVEQTLLALPTFTPAPSHTPVVVVATNTLHSTPADTETSTLPATSETTALPIVSNSITSTINATLISTATSTPLLLSVSGTPTAHPIFYGTLPPNLPFGQVVLVNKSKAEAYVSLQCTTKSGHKTILEYPVPGQVRANIPAGKCVYVVWVGGNKITGEFGLSVGDDKTVTIYKDRVRVK